MNSSDVTPYLKMEDNETNINTDIDSIPMSNSKVELSSCELCKSLLGAAVGNFLEWFDFAIFGLLADEIGHNFFPKGPENLHLIQAFAVYAGAFCMRPLGGALFGYIGDKYGRLTALRISVFMMAFPTFLTGCLPTYHQIGITATILLVILRLIQGISVGGEITGALVYVVEICPPNRRSLFAVLVQVSGSGTLLAIIVEATLRGIFTDKQIYVWAWRIPFLAGVIVAVFGIWMRKALPMSDEFLNKRDAGKLKKNPIFHVLWNNKLIIFVLICHLSVGGASYYTMFVWLPTYLTDLKDPPLENAYSIAIGVLIFTMCLNILSGHLGDVYSPIKVLLTGGVIYLLVFVIVFPFFETANEGMCILIYVTIAGLFGIYSGPGSVWALNQIRDASIRYTTLGIGYNISLALFGGTAPLFATAIVRKSGIVGWAWVIFAYGVVAVTTQVLVTLYNIKREKHMNNNKMISVDNETDLYSL